MTSARLISQVFLEGERWSGLIDLAHTRILLHQFSKIQYRVFLWIAQVDRLAEITIHETYQPVH